MPIHDTEAYREKHHIFCVENNLLGRIIVAPEGLNGTVSGLTENCHKYMKWLEDDPIFHGTNFDFKVEEHGGHTFTKLHVRIKEEIVNSDLGVSPRVQTGKHLEPAEFKEMYHNDSEVVLVDVRSTYEHKVGKFKGAITFDMENLRELPEHIKEIEHLKSKKIITYCTGGIKCEKASAYLLERGFENVYQLHGGIIKYGLEAGGEDFEGKCYVFDDRLTIDVNVINPVVISTCHICEITSDFMVNCANPVCNAHLVICPTCFKEMDGACSESCKTHPRKRPYNPEGCYLRQSKNYSPEFGFKSRQRTKIVTSC
jgi:UPF0176 protein